MKRIIYTLFFAGFLFTVTSADAQVSVNINIGSQPQWGPVGYNYARFYYMPEIDIYYDVVQSRYTYYQGNRWVTARSMPKRYRHVDVYKTYKVVLNNDNPWRNHNQVRKQYARYSSNHTQHILRDARGNHRHVVKDKYTKKHYKKHKRNHKRD
ncbi:hypothetical protein [Sphingobacterium sp. LRF_L2]|uniref:hypothetical protein n=1 Tax=Sphingobacterium sp. LRF_L2 TaxID=3369421 RepID=UPI003F615A39